MSNCALFFSAIGAKKIPQNSSSVDEYQREGWYSVKVVTTGGASQIYGMRSPNEENGFYLNIGFAEPTPEEWIEFDKFLRWNRVPGGWKKA